MSLVDVVIEYEVQRSIHVRQLEGMFDVPAQKKMRLEWKLDMPIEDLDWQIGLIVGPSGCGKSTLARHVFGNVLQSTDVQWSGRAVVDDLCDLASIEEVSRMCSSVGFNTIPAWMRPYAVLSNGEQFRAYMARLLLQDRTPIVCDEFTSVVDRQVAKIVSHSVQKEIRRRAGRRFVAVTCHEDVEDWLQPDWILEPATQIFRRRSLRRRPSVEVVISPTHYDMWRVFAPYHYLSAELSPSSRCWVLFVDGKPASFCGVLGRPHPRYKTVHMFGVSRLVTLPDYQGLGLAFVLSEYVGSVYRGMGLRYRNYPAHPSFIRQYDKSERWKLVRRPGHETVTPSVRSPTSTIEGWGERPCAVFEYVGPAMDKEQAGHLLSFWRDGLHKTLRKACSV